MLSNHPDTHPGRGTEHVRAEQLRIFFEASRRTLIPAVLLGSIVAFTLLSVVRHWALWAWCALLLGTYGLRAHLHGQARHLLRADALNLRFLERRAVIGAALTGAAWGLLPLLPLQLNQFEYLLFFAFVIGGVTASATPSLGAYGAAAYAFVLPGVLPLSVRMFIWGSPLAEASAVMILLYLWVVYATVHRVAAGLEEAVQLRVQADARGLELAASRSELQRHQRLTNIIAQSQTDFIRGVPAQQLQQTLLSNLRELAGASVATLMEAAAQPPRTPRLTICNAAGIDAAATRSVSNSPEVIELLAGSVLPGSAVRIADPTHPLCRALSVAGQPLVDLIGVPLQLGDRAIGILALGSAAAPLEAGLLGDLQGLSTTLAHLLLAMHTEQQRRDTAARLERALSQLQTCVTDTPAAVAMLDRELNLIASSQRWLNDFGAQVQPVSGRPLYEVVPEIPLRWRESFAQVLSGHVQVCDEDPLIRGDGTVRWLRWEARPWYDVDGGVGGLMLFSEDVTTQKKTNDALYARERLLEQLTDRVPGLLFQMRQRADGERSLLYVSSGALRVLRMTPDVLIENPARIFDACHPEDRKLLDAAVARAEVNGLLQATYRSQCANGEIRWLSIQADAIRLADASCVWHGYIDDITEHVRLRDHCQSAQPLTTADESRLCPLRHAALGYTSLVKNLETTT